MIRILRLTIRGALVVLALFWFGFALLSGAAGTGQGIISLIRNLPNALPWLALFVFVYIAFRWELAGGVLITLAGVGSILFFDVGAAPLLLFAISLPLMLLGSALILCWVLSKPRDP